MLNKLRELPEEDRDIDSVVAKIQRFLDTYEELPKSLRKVLQNRVHAQFPAEFFRHAQRIGCFKKQVAIAKEFRANTASQLSDNTVIDGCKWHIWKREAMKENFEASSRFKYRSED